MAEEQGFTEFAELITQIGDGQANQELTDRLTELLEKLTVEAASQGKAQGTFTCALKFEITNKGTCYVKLDKVDTKAPAPLRDQWSCFVNDKGVMSRAPFRQEKLPFEGRDNVRKLS
jgi:hypothetical protein